MAPMIFKVKKQKKCSDKKECINYNFILFLYNINSKVKNINLVLVKEISLVSETISYSMILFSFSKKY
jgi:hypothetical protein